MIRYPLEKWTRFALAAVAFCVALLLTPRALLDVTDQADSHEVPVDMLEPSDSEECSWCSPEPTEDEQIDCEDLDQQQRHWLNPDRIDTDELPSECRDDQPALEPSA